MSHLVEAPAVAAPRAVTTPPAVESPPDGGSPPRAVLLARDRRRVAIDVCAVVRLDRWRRGAVASALAGGGARRAEPGPAGPLVMEARPSGDGVTLEVWGPEPTPVEVAEDALLRAASWVGLDDDPDALAPVVAGHPLLSRLARMLPPVRLSRVPRVFEAFGRAVLEQLVQSAEAHRSIALVAASHGTAATGGVWSWPTPAQLGATPAWDLRRCGVSLRGARALHAGAVSDGRLEQARTDFARLDRRLRALPGVGVWTSAETRGALGDADAVSVGDSNLPGIIGSALAGREPRDCDDAFMLELLAPFSGQRGRVIRLVGSAMRHRLIAPPPRRAPRAAYSRHRYW